MAATARIIGEGLRPAGPDDRPQAIVGPNGKSFTVEDLPPPTLKRWSKMRKAEVVLAVCGGLISLREVCRRYDLSPEEFYSWQHLIENFGVAGLRATRLQDYRGASHPAGTPREVPRVR